VPLSVFWLAAALVVVAYAGYPAAIVALGGLRPRAVRKSPVRPTVTLVIAAHNEAANLARKLENCLALRYPAPLLDVVVASDGSTDGTPEVAAAFAGRGVRSVPFPERRGKAAVLNDVVPRCRGEIVVLSDARQAYDAGAIVALVENFADPEVGAASGELHLLAGADHSRVGQGVGAYWRYEKIIRRYESRLDSSVGVTGAIYAIRRALFEPIPRDTLVDDVLIPLRIVRRGYRVVFEPGARAFDRAARTPREEFVRKVRTIAGTLQLFARERWLWNPRANRLWGQAIAHKLLRIACPLCLVAMLIASAVLAGTSAVYRAALGAQLLFYAAALLGRSGRFGGGLRWLSLPYAFCLLNAAALVGIYRFATRSQAVTWRKASDVEFA
jgi:cellulose synthase/poly-beta-1,6-N-acetylglucosamine synthase-like glycosyltransferase